MARTLLQPPKEDNLLLAQLGLVARRLVPPDHKGTGYFYTVNVGISMFEDCVERGLSDESESERVKQEMIALGMPQGGEELREKLRGADSPAPELPVGITPLCMDPFHGELAVHEVPVQLTVYSFSDAFPELLKRVERTPLKPAHAAHMAIVMARHALLSTTMGDYWERARLLTVDALEHEGYEPTEVARFTERFGGHLPFDLEDKKRLAAKMRLTKIEPGKPK